MDIGRKASPEPDLKPIQPVNKPEVEAEPITPVTDPVLPPQESPLSTPTPIQAEIKPEQVTSFALSEDNEPKTFPLAPVLVVIGILVVVGLVYLLVFV